MLQVLLAGLGHLFTLLVRGERLHARAQEGLAAEKGCIGLAMRKHYHVPVVNPVALLPVLILSITYESPEHRQILQRDQVYLQVFNFLLSVRFIDNLPGKLFDHFVGILIAEDDIDGLEADRPSCFLTLLEKVYKCCIALGLLVPYQDWSRQYSINLGCCLVAVLAALTMEYRRGLLFFRDLLLT